MRRRSDVAWADASRPGDVDARQQAGHHAEQRQRRVAAADVGPVLPHGPERPLARQGAQVAAGVGDDREAGGVGMPLPRPRQVAAGLECGARLRRGDVQRAVGRQLGAEAGDGVGVGRVEDVEPGRPRPGVAGPAEHLGEQAGPAHPHEQHVVDAVGGLAARGAQAVEGGDHVGYDGQPAEPVGDLGRVVAPQRVVGRPGPGDGVAFGEFGERGGRRLCERPEAFGGVVQDHLPFATSRPAVSCYPADGECCARWVVAWSRRTRSVLFTRPKRTACARPTSLSRRCRHPRRQRGLLAPHRRDRARPSARRRPARATRRTARPPRRPTGTAPPRPRGGPRRRRRGPRPRHPAARAARLGAGRHHRPRHPPRPVDGVRHRPRRRCARRSPAPSSATSTTSPRARPGSPCTRRSSPCSTRSATSPSTWPPR